LSEIAGETEVILFQPGHVSMLQESQRTLVLQGGGSRGAHEARVYQALYERITKKDKESEIRDRPVFDIVAGRWYRCTRTYRMRSPGFSPIDCPPSSSGEVETNNNDDDDDSGDIEKQIPSVLPLP
jgi:hypothetical protein